MGANTKADPFSAALRMHAAESGWDEYEREELLLRFLAEQSKTKFTLLGEFQRFLTREAEATALIDDRVDEDEDDFDVDDPADDDDDEDDDEEDYDDEDEDYDDEDEDEDDEDDFATDEDEDEEDYEDVG